MEEPQFLWRNDVTHLQQKAEHWPRVLVIVVENLSFVHESLSNRKKLALPIEQVIFQSTVTLVHLYTTHIFEI